MSRTRLYSVLELDGSVTETRIPYTAEDYLDDIAALESSITPRRMREALLGEEGLDWLKEAEATLASLRSELAALKAELDS
jgi:hypothetical protein